MTNLLSADGQWALEQVLDRHLAVLDEHDPATVQRAVPPIHPDGSDDHEFRSLLTGMLLDDHRHRCLQVSETLADRTLDRDIAQLWLRVFNQIRLAALDRLGVPLERLVNDPDLDLDDLSGDDPERDLRCVVVGTVMVSDLTHALDR